MKRIKWFVLLLLFTENIYAQKFEGLALTPPMGWNSWNTFQANISEELVKQTADVIVSSGMKDAGYAYLVLDDGWMAMQRDSITGDLVPDPKKFPNGMKILVDYVHSKGLKFGLYNCAGTKTCGGYPGSRGYEYQDARLYASFGIDYLKYDWCSTDGMTTKEAYTTMSKALKAARRPIIFSLCEWGSSQPWQWAKEVGHLWRTTGDITAQFDGIKSYGTWHASGVMTIVDMQDTLYKYGGPGHWNDPDMLEVGNGLSAAEDRSHFAIWCMLAAPLMAGNDIRKMSGETGALLTDKDLIAIDQDAAGMQAFRYLMKDSVDIWVKPLSKEEWAVCFLNRSVQTKNITFDWKANIITNAFFSKTLTATASSYRIRDLFGKKEMGTTAAPLKTSVPAHDVLIVRLRKN